MIHPLKITTIGKSPTLLIDQEANSLLLFMAVLQWIFNKDII